MESLQLQDIHLPESASFWPLALGWWILLVMIILVTTLLVIKAIKRARQKRYQRKILDKFSSLEKKLKAKPSNATIAEINTLLRQLAITYYPRTEVASLTGSDWLCFLDESGSTHEFSRGAGRILIEAPYRLENQLEDQADRHIENLNINEFLPLIQNWAKKIIRGNSHG